MAQPASLENHKKNLYALLSSMSAARSLSSHLVDAQTGPGPRSGSVASLPQAVRAQKSLGTSMAMRLKSTFDALKTVEDAMATEDMQSALSTVRDLSATAPPVAVSRKRKRVEPKTITPPPKRQNTARFDIPQVDYEAPSFPDLSPAEPWPRDRESVEAWVRAVNQDRTVRLQIWSVTKPYDNLTPTGPLPDPMYLRYIIKNTLVAFVVVSRKQNGDMAVEAINTFGPLERKLPHSQSDHAVFSNLTQFLAGLLQSQPDVSLPAVINLLSSYKSLYMEPCVNCAQTWTVEGHLPPIQRIWVLPIKTGPDPQPGRWMARHLLCSPAPPGHMT